MSQSSSDSDAARRGGTGKWVLLIGTLAAAAGYLAYKRSTEKVDPWATAGSYTPPLATPPADEATATGEDPSEPQE